MHSTKSFESSISFNTILIIRLPVIYYFFIAVLFKCFVIDDNRLSRHTFLYNNIQHTIHTNTCLPLVGGNTVDVAYSSRLHVTWLESYRNP